MDYAANGPLDPPRYMPDGCGMCECWPCACDEAYELMKDQREGMK